jgi:hypothetical protein
MAAPGKHPKRGRKVNAKAAHKPGVGRKTSRKPKTKRSTPATAAPATA